MDGLGTKELYGFEVTYDLQTGYVIKRSLPHELDKKMCTRKQWLSVGRIPKEDERPTRMILSARSKFGRGRNCDYYHISQTQTFEEAGVEEPQNCLTCELRDGKQCSFTHEYVGERDTCSSWVVRDWQSKPKRINKKRK